MIKKIFLLSIIVIFSVNVHAQSKGTIAGKVVDKITKEPLIGINIVIVGTNYGASTGLNGEFEIKDLEAGTYQVRISAIGYNTITRTDVVVQAAKPAYLNIELSEAVFELDGVVVRSDYFEMAPAKVNSTASFGYEEIRRAPGGFEDVVRALSVLPGVGQANPGRNDLVVRGGAPSENLFIVDGFVIPNINHFGSQGATGGPLSYVNLDFVRQIEFSTGGFPSNYGDKLSSVLKIDLRDGRQDRLGGKATISASQFGLNVEGPLWNSGDFIFSVRRSYLDFIFDAAGFNFVPEYYDVLGKTTINLTKKDKISFLFVSAFDNVKFNNNDSEDIYENSRILASDQIQYAAGLSYRHLFDDGFFTISLSRNFVDYNSSQKDTLFNPIFTNISQEAENELKADLVYKLSSSSELNVGISGKLIKFNADIKLPGFVTSFGDTLSIDVLKSSSYYNKYAFYAQYSDVFFHRLTFSFGSRLDYFSEINNKLYFSPRLALSYMLTDLLSVNFSTGIYHQSPSYVWLAASPVNRDLKAVKVNQYIAGLEYRLQDDLRVKIEGFLKDYSNYPASLIRPYLVLANTGAGFGGSDENFASFGLDPLLSEGKGNVQGVEFSMQKRSSDTPFYGILSLTYSESFFTALDGIKRPGSYDQKWILNLSTGYIFSNKWEASLKFRYASGTPYTPFNNDGTQSVENFNSARFKAAHSLDLRVDRRWNFEN